MDYSKQCFERLFKDSYPHMYRMAFMNRVPEERQVALKKQIKTLMGEEGTRILSLMPQRWTPGSLFGKNRSVRYNIAIIFNITDAERKPISLRSKPQMTYCDDYISKHPELKKERHYVEGYIFAFCLL